MLLSQLILTQGGSTTPQLITNKDNMSTLRNVCRSLDRNPNNLNLKEAQGYRHHIKNYKNPIATSYGL